MNKMMPIPAGSLFTVTAGCYSDYHIHGVFRAIAKIDADQLIVDWLAEHPEQKKPYCFDVSAFLAAIARKGLIESIDCFEWHLGDYDSVDEIGITKMSRDKE